MTRGLSIGSLVCLVGCAQVALSPSTSVCTDYAFDDDDPAIFIVQADTDGDGYGDSDVLSAGDGIVVSHVGVFMGCEDVFSPDISASGRKIEVRETWTESTDGDCSLCFAPSVVLEAAPAGKFSVAWYDGYADTPLAELEFRVE
jgi:hypothetical protein